ncbi:unnamed protein product [Symbiodinium natans]|uniref:Uncharacterized protein n=1 Tax=Symbiodinium natans TaxID=878477 RepID=A0A812R6V9_9DINO|nr:unnamed protein product [Symbiodinium natans]
MIGQKTEHAQRHGAFISWQLLKLSTRGLAPGMVMHGQVPVARKLHECWGWMFFWCMQCVSPISCPLRFQARCRPAGRATGTLAVGHLNVCRGSESTFVDGFSSVQAAQRFEGTTRAKYLRRLRHRRWCAQFEYPRTFGYVLKWNDKAGEGVVIDQEQTQKYLVIRDEIGASYHAHKTLQVAEFVEFFATDEMDEASVYTVQFSIASLDSC